MCVSAVAGNKASVASSLLEIRITTIKSMERLRKCIIQLDFQPQYAFIYINENKEIEVEGVQIVVALAVYSVNNISILIEKQRNVYLILKKKRIHFMVKMQMQNINRFQTICTQVSCIFATVIGQMQNSISKHRFL